MCSYFTDLRLKYIETCYDINYYAYTF